MKLFSRKANTKSGAVLPAASDNDLDTIPVARLVSKPISVESKPAPMAFDVDVDVSDASSNVAIPVLEVKAVEPEGKDKVQAVLGTTWRSSVPFMGWHLEERRQAKLVEQIIRDFERTPTMTSR